MTRMEHSRVVPAPNKELDRQNRAYACCVVGVGGVRGVEGLQDAEAPNQR